MGCIEELSYNILAKGMSFPKSRQYIEKTYAEVYHIMPGTKIFGDPLIGPPPIAIGIEGDLIVFPYVKPCHGTFLLSIEDSNEALRIRQTAKYVGKKR
ncbi:DUF1894 domain-containing protein [Methanospirillum purgamenti]|jgi:hypothetical protein|uniref:DUF1894 domain-containing protein n=1 Tax=Methanospirillum hungatei TaxID=2203 RepID=A0A8F5VM27_METHU|nr:DUF1894 domain-containing protein [Methanospirillum hungatei]QXO93980.1 DUF1894 domain-containing protein [Methanospirillum hungatei]